MITLFHIIIIINCKRALLADIYHTMSRENIFKKFTKIQCFPKELVIYLIFL